MKRVNENIEIIDTSFRFSGDDEVSGHITLSIKCYKKPTYLIKKSLENAKLGYKIGRAEYEIYDMHLIDVMKTSYSYKIAFSGKYRYVG